MGKIWTILLLTALALSGKVESKKKKKIFLIETEMEVNTENKNTKQGADFTFSRFDPRDRHLDDFNAWRGKNMKIKKGIWGRYII